MAADLEPHLQKLSTLAPGFGRLRDDIDTMVSRGRTGDYKGVMQNARLVVEALLRSLVTEELKQTPGKAMLDELVTKFRQQANAGIIPTNILAHVGTVQAWGNLSSHDHAGGLGDEGVHVGQDEVIASLNSVAAILSWYAAKKGLAEVAPSPLGERAGVRGVAPSAYRRSRGPLLVGGTLLLGALAVGGYFATRSEASKSKAEPPAASNPYEALDALYASWKEPPPPAACRTPGDAAKLARAATDLLALSLLENPGAEAAYLRARATWQQKKERSPALDVALKCRGFAAAEGLAADLALTAKDLDEAHTRLKAAVAAAPTFLAARVKLAGLLAQTGKLDEALVEVDAVVAADPELAAAWLVRSAVKEQKGIGDEAQRDLCTAVKLGSAQARALARGKGLPCAL